MNVILPLETHPSENRLQASASYQLLPREATIFIEVKSPEGLKSGVPRAGSPCDGNGQAALAARGLTVAELPKEFLKELRWGAER